jgi:hypothetical protein
VQTPKSFDELKKDTEGEGEFSESTSWPLINAKIVVAVVGIFLFHALFQISQIKRRVVSIAEMIFFLR